MGDQPKPIKSGARRRPATRLSMAAASSPTPGSMNAFSATCGHDGCGSGGCNVRYVGPVSHVRDHHALHAARGVAHVWTAAVVSGLAVVLTGVVAYNAQAAAPAVRRPAAPSGEMRAVMERLDRMERAMHEMTQRCMDDGQGGMDDQMNGGQPSAEVQEEMMRKKNEAEEARREVPPPPRREPPARERPAADQQAPAGGATDPAPDSATGTKN